MEVSDSIQDFLPLETTDCRTGNDGDEAGVVGKTGTCMVDTVAVVNQCEDMDWSVSQNCCDIPSEINDSLLVDETAKDSCSENTQDNSDIRLNIKSEDGSCQKLRESRTAEKEGGSSRICVKSEVISESESGLPCGKDAINPEGSSDEDFFKDHEEFTDICSSYEYDSATLSENSQSILGNTNEADIANCTVPSNSSCLQIKMEPEDKQSVSKEDCLKDHEEFPDFCLYDSDASSENSQSILEHANETDIADNVVPSNSSCLQIKMEPENRKSSSNEDFLDEFTNRCSSYDSDASNENSQSILEHANETDIADNVVPPNSSCLQIKMEPENKSNDTLGNSNENKSQVTSVVIHGSSQRQQGAKMQQQTLRSYSDKSTRSGNASNKSNARNNLKQSDIGVYFGLKPVERPALKNETPVASLTQNEQSKAGKDVPKGWASRKQCNLRSSQHTRKTAAGYSSSGGGDSTGSDSWHRPCPFYKKIQGMYLLILGNNTNNTSTSNSIIVNPLLNKGEH